MSDYDVSKVEFGSEPIDQFLEDTVRFPNVVAFKNYITKYNFKKPASRVAKTLQAGDSNLLVNRATQDYWAVESGQDGSVVIRRLVEDNSINF